MNNSITNQVFPVIVWDEFLQRRQIRIMTRDDVRSLVDKSPAFQQEASAKLFKYLYDRTYPSTSEIITAPMMQNLLVCNSAKWRGKEKR